MLQGSLGIEKTLTPFHAVNFNTSSIDATSSALILECSMQLDKIEAHLRGVQGVGRFAQILSPRQKRLPHGVFSVNEKIGMSVPCAYELIRS
jgi:hypothetical protein